MCVYFCFGGLLVLIAQNVIPGVFFGGGGGLCFMHIKGALTHTMWTVK